MKLEKITDWMDKTLNVAAFDDVSNNGLQIGCFHEEVKTVAFAVDASLEAIETAAERGAELLVVHHGISWGGGIKRLTGGLYHVVDTAMSMGVALYACHLPLDAHPVLGNNAQLAKLFKLKNVKPAFSYHGNVIGLVGKCSVGEFLDGCKLQGWQTGHFGDETTRQSQVRVGICSGGAGEFAEEAKRLGCDVYVTGEANWGDVIAAENCGMRMFCFGHYATEVFGVRAVSKAMKKTLKVKTVDLTETLHGCT